MRLALAAAALLFLGCATAQKVPLYSVEEYELATLEPGSGGGFPTLPPLQLVIFGQSEPTAGFANEHAGQDMLARSITLSAVSGANAVGVSTNGARIDVGTGASDYFTSNGTVITAGTNLTVSGNISTSSDVTGRDVYITRSAQFTAAPLLTCGAGLIGFTQNDSTGGAAAVYSKLCMCRFDGTTYKWFNAFNPTVTTGTTTTCPN